MTPERNLPGKDFPADGVYAAAVGGGPAPTDAAPAMAAKIAEVEAVAAKATAEAGGNDTAGPDSTTAGVAMVKMLLAAHGMLRKDLDSIRETIQLISSGAAGDAATAAEVRERVEALAMGQSAWQLKSFCDTYCQTVHAHHGIEDFRIFPAVVAIAPETAPVVERLTADHVTLGGLLDTLNSAVDALPSAAAWTAATDAARELAEQLEAHLELEEKHILPPLGRLPDWV